MRPRPRGYRQAAPRPRTGRLRAGPLRRLLRALAGGSGLPVAWLRLPRPPGPLVYRSRLRPHDRREPAAIARAPPKHDLAQAGAATAWFHGSGPGTGLW